MRRKTKERLDALEASATLTLIGAGGESLVTFPADIVQSLRRMATLLIANGTLPRRLALVSALREEGVTYTSLALATILAHDTEKTVGLVELNWESPGLARLIGAQNGELGQRDGQVMMARQSFRGDSVMSGKPIAMASSAIPARGNPQGLAAMLTEGVTLDEVILWTGAPKLAILPAGQLPREGREALVRGPRLKQAIDQMGEFFDYLLLDVPAVAATSDAVPLVRLGDAVLLVIRQGATPRRAVTAALEDLGTSKVLGIILNRVHVATPGWISGHEWLIDTGSSHS